jgi:hypothetical protein
MQQYYLTRIFNIVLIFLCIVILIISSQKLFWSENRLDSTLPKIGLIQNLLNEVKVKKYHMLSWHATSNHASLHGYDMIFTHQNAKAQVELGQHRITIMPLTMLMFENTQSLQLDQGGIEIFLSDDKHPLKLNIGKKTYHLRSKNAHLSLIQPNHKRKEITVIEGSVALEEEGSSKTIHIGQNQQAILEGTLAEVISSHLQLITPVNQTYFTDKQQHEIMVEAQLLRKNVVELIFALDENFTNIYHRDKEFSGKKFYTLPKQDYFWMVKDELHKSEIGRFSIIQNVNLENPIPRDDHTEYSFSDQHTVEFSWTALDTKNKELIIYNQDHESVHRTKITKNVYQWATQLTGHFYWQIVSLDPSERILNKPTQKFSIHKVNINDQQAKIIELKKPNQQVEFSWIKNNSRHLSRFELSNDPHFKQIIITKKLQKNSTRISFPETGVYYWRSYEMDDAGNTIALKPIKVIIKPTPEPKRPKALPKLEIKIKKSEYPKPNFNLFAYAWANDNYQAELSWPAISDAKIYEIEIFSDRSLKHKIKTIKASKNSYLWQPPRLGQFYWRFRFQDYWGRYSPFSEASELLLKEELKEESASSKELAQSHKKDQNRNKLSINLGPSQIKYQHKNKQNFNIDGLALNSMSASYEYQLQNQNRLLAHIEQIAGEVFDDQKFVFRQMNLDYTKELTSFHLLIGTKIFQLPSYKLENQKASFSQSYFHYMANIGAIFNWQFASLSSKIDLAFYQGNLLNFQTSWIAIQKSHYKWLAHLTYVNSSINNEQNKIHWQYWQLSFGPQIEF